MQKLSMSELNRKSAAEFKAAEKNPVIVVLENIRSAYNVGSVFRTADAFLIEAVYTCGYTAHPPHKQVNKTALGADEAVSTIHFANAAEAIKKLKQDNFRVFAIEQVKHSISLNNFSINKEDKIAVIFGNEVTGVEQSTILMCDGCIEIPQFGMKHSLNISVAAGIVLWDLISSFVHSS